MEGKCVSICNGTRCTTRSQHDSYVNYFKLFLEGRYDRTCRFLRRHTIINSKGLAILGPEFNLNHTRSTQCVSPSETCLLPGTTPDGNVRTVVHSYFYNKPILSFRSRAVYNNIRFRTAPQVPTFKSSTHDECQGRSYHTKYSVSVCE